MRCDTPGKLVREDEPPARAPRRGPAPARRRPKTPFTAAVPGGRRRGDGSTQCGIVLEKNTNYLPVTAAWCGGGRAPTWRGGLDGKSGQWLWADPQSGERAVASGPGLHREPRPPPWAREAVGGLRPGSRGAKNLIIHVVPPPPPAPWGREGRRGRGRQQTLSRGSAPRAQSPAPGTAAGAGGGEGQSLGA